MRYFYLIVHTKIFGSTMNTLRPAQETTKEMKSRFPPQKKTPPKKKRDNNQKTKRKIDRKQVVRKNDKLAVRSFQNQKKSET